jgi:acetoin utilization protein AcuB
MIAKDLMTTDVISVGLHTSVFEAMQLMETENIRHLPVVDAGQVAGIISDRDLARFSRDALLADQPEAGARLRTALSQVMTGSPVTVAADDDVDEVIELFIDSRISAVPVTDPDGKLIGIVSVIDVLRAAMGKL